MMTQMVLLQESPHEDGFEVYVLKDALAWVDADGHVEALKAMEEEGIHLI